MTVFSAIQYDLPYLPGVEHHFWNYARARIIERHLRRSDSKTVNHQALVLDVGVRCGPHCRLSSSRRFGLSGCGTRASKLRPGLDDFVKIGTDARDLPVDIREQTGTILLLDVLEHIQDPVAFIAELRANFPMLERVVIRCRREWNCGRTTMFITAIFCDTTCDNWLSSSIEQRLK